jgi:hypothetical protein
MYGHAKEAYRAMILRYKNSISLVEEKEYFLAQSSLSKLLLDYFFRARPINYDISIELA